MSVSRYQILLTYSSLVLAPAKKPKSYFLFTLDVGTKQRFNQCQYNYVVLSNEDAKQKVHECLILDIERETFYRYLY